MKKLFLFCFLALMAVCISAQTLQKGNLVGVHLISMTLNAGVTEDQVMDFVLNKYIPAYEKLFPGVHVYLAKGIRGENADRYYQFVVMENDEVRNKIFNAEGTYTDEASAKLANIQPLLDEYHKMATITSVYTDCIVQ